MNKYFIKMSILAMIVSISMFTLSCGNSPSEGASEEASLAEVTKFVDEYEAFAKSYCDLAAKAAGNVTSEYESQTNKLTSLTERSIEMQSSMDAGSAEKMGTLIEKVQKCGTTLQEKMAK